MVTVAAVSSGGTWKTPKPSWGMVVWSFRVIVGTVMEGMTTRGSRLFRSVEPRFRAPRVACEPWHVDFLEYDTRLAAYAVIVDQHDRILLALWNEADDKQWTMPGGGVELHETPEEGAIRELREETGYDVRLARVLGVDTHVVPAEQRHVPNGRPLRSVRVIFEAEVVGGELTHEVDGTTDEARWIPLDEVAVLPRVSLIDRAIEVWRASADRGV